MVVMCFLATSGYPLGTSTAIAAGLANGLEVRDAVSQAKKYVTGALRHALPIGARGTVNHVHEMRSGG